MAYSFVPPGGGQFGGGIFSQGIGAALLNANKAGIDLAQQFRQYQNQNMLDQFSIPAKEAQLDAVRLGAANDVVENQGLLNGLTAMASTPAGPYIMPAGAPADANIGMNQGTVSGILARTNSGTMPQAIPAGSNFEQLLMGSDNPYAYQNFDPNRFADPNGVQGR